MKFLLLILAILLTAMGPSWETGNALASEYNHWAELRNEHVAGVGTLSAAEVAQWRRVKTAWGRLQSQIDAEYRGER